MWNEGVHFTLLLAGAVFALFLKVALGSETFFFRDFAALGYPYAVYLHDSLWGGELPLWNPFSHAGVPFMAQMGVWYPPALLASLLPIPWAVNFFELLHLIWGGTGVYCLCRQWDVEKFAAQAAGLAFVFNGVTLSCLVWGNYIASLAWMPWVVITVKMACQYGRQYTVLAAVFSALQVLTGTPEITLVFWIGLIALLAGAVFKREMKPTKVVLRVGLVVAIASALTMVQMLPFLDLLVHSQREIAGRESAAWAMPGWGWANLFVPLFHTYHSPQGQWFQYGQEFLVSYYLGISAIVLAAFGLLIRPERKFLTIGGLTLLCWILALGNDGVLFGWLNKVFPLISIARFPVKYAIPTAFFLPLLMAWGISGIQPTDWRSNRKLVFIGMSALCLVALFVLIAKLYPFPYDDWPATAANAALRSGLMLLTVGGVWLATKLPAGKYKLGLQLLVLAVFPLDAFTHNEQQAPTLPTASLTRNLWQLSDKPLPPALGQGRIMISPEAERLLTYSPIKNFALDLTGKRLAEWYNLNLLDQIPKVNGAITLRPSHFDFIERQLYYTKQTFGQPLLDFLSIAWISSSNNPTEWEWRATALPLVTAGQRPIFATADQSWQAMKGNDFVPLNVVYLPEQAAKMITVTNQTECTVTGLKFKRNQVSFTTETTAPSMVVLSQTYYHHWKANVSGNCTPLFQANLAFQALEVPAGQHEVILTYSDPNFKIGAIISGVTLFGCLWFGVRRKREVLPPFRPQRGPT